MLAAEVESTVVDRVGRVDTCCRALIADVHPIGFSNRLSGGRVGQINTTPPGPPESLP